MLILNLPVMLHLIILHLPLQHLRVPTLLLQLRLLLCFNLLSHSQDLLCTDLILGFMLDLLHLLAPFVFLYLVFHIIIGHDSHRFVVGFLIVFLNLLFGSVFI